MYDYNYPLPSLLYCINLGQYYCSGAWFSFMIHMILLKVDPSLSYGVANAQAWLTASYISLITKISWGMSMWYQESQWDTREFFWGSQKARCSFPVDLKGPTYWNYQRHWYTGGLIQMKSISKGNKPSGRERKARSWRLFESLFLIMSET